MKLSIRMKIFLPVMAILIAFPVAAWLAFGYTLRVDMNFQARRDLERLIKKVERAAGTENGFPGAPGDDSFQSKLRGLMRTDKGESRAMALDETYRLLYPKESNGQPETDLIFSWFSTRNSQDGAALPTEDIREEMIDQKHYLLYCMNLDEAAGGKVRHLVLYCRIHDPEPILQQVSRLVLLVMALIAAAAILIFWFVAGSISGPVRRLCEAARGIGDKKFQKVETKATVKELCELENEINRMQEKLEQADLAERTFFQNASHELRTPLMSISGYAQGIQCGVFSDVSQAAGVILEESSRLTEVVDGILALTRMDQLRLEVIPSEIRLEEFVSAHLERLEGLAYAKNVRLVFEPEEEHTVYLDPTLLARAFTNVVSNCIRYAKSQVYISIERCHDALTLRVEDDGPGLSPSDLEHLFDRFYKGEDGNHGLGLAIAKSSLEYMGARISAGSTGSGSLFEITL